MMTDKEMNSIKTQRLCLRILRAEDVTPDYIAWLNNKEVNRYLDFREAVQTHETVTGWINDAARDQTRMVFGVFLDDLHIGNVTFYDIERINRSMCIGICIGRQSAQGKGYGLEALRAGVEYAFSQMNIHRIEAGINEINISSVKLFEKCGFKKDTVLRERLFFEGKFVGKGIYSLLSSD